MDEWRYICLEGPDLVGKTTMANRISAWLAEMGIESIIAPQPGATALGAKLRHIIKHDDKVAIGMETEALVFVLDQMAFVENLLLEAQKDKVWVISDRNNYISGLVYQVLNGVDPRRLDHFYSVVPTPQMDMVVLLNAPPAVLKERAKARGTDKWDRYESNLGFMEKVYAAYGSLINDHAKRLAVISKSIAGVDATRDENGVFEQIEEALKALL